MNWNIRVKCQYASLLCISMQILPMHRYPTRDCEYSFERVVFETQKARRERSEVTHQCWIKHLVLVCVSHAQMNTFSRSTVCFILSLHRCVHSAEDCFSVDHDLPWRVSDVQYASNLFGFETNSLRQSDSALRLIFQWRIQVLLAFNEAWQQIRNYIYVVNLIFLILNFLLESF